MFMDLRTDESGAAPSDGTVEPMHLTPAALPYSAPQTTILVTQSKKKNSWEVSTYGKIYVSLVAVEATSLIGLCIAAIVYAHEK
jgi:hypothetical protein